ncbi:MAG: mannitol dehydrogenase family protein [Mycetocola sp.]
MAIPVTVITPHSTMSKRTTQMRLSAQTTPESPVAGRSRGGEAIVHIGVGNFHRAHQAMIYDRLLHDGGDNRWRICGVGLMPGDRAMRDALEPQDYLYTLTEKNPDGSTRSQVIGSITDFLVAPEDPEAVIARLADPGVAIVSLTITEGGYNINRSTGEFERDAPAILADVASPERPTTVFGYVTAALRRRRDNGTAPFTVLSCDNIPGNGEVARNSVCAFADLVDPELAAWIRTTVAFPNSMVDRITPVTTDADRAAVESERGYTDAWPVVCEPFIQWVLEDTFPLGRPALENAGVQLVADVEPFELMKLRMLNAAHQAIAYPGRLLGYEYAHEAIADERILALVRAYFEREAIPSLPAVPDTNLQAYGEELISRFGNPAIRDTLARLATDGSDRIPKFLLPVTTASLDHGRSVRASALIIASWARDLRGLAEDGAELSITDLIRDDLTAAAHRSAESGDVADFLSLEQVFGQLGHNQTLLRATQESYRLIAEDGVAAALAAAVS